MSDPVRKGVELLATSCFYLANFLFLQCDLSRIELARIIRLTLENLLSVQTDPIRSTNLDSWTNAQLRLMKVGGNGNATEFFASHGGNHLLAPSTEGKLKYTSAVANLYKEELSKRALADAKGLPLSSPVHFPGLAASKSTGAAPLLTPKPNLPPRLEVEVAPVLTAPRPAPLRGAVPVGVEVPDEGLDDEVV